MTLTARAPVAQGAPEPGFSEGGGDATRAEEVAEMAIDREALLERTDLVELFGEMVGPVRKEGAGWRVPCPSPNHAQTGKTPPANIDPAGRLWSCKGCSAGGTAIDVVMLVRGVDVGEAMGFLASKVGLADRPAFNDRPAPRPGRGRTKPALKRPASPKARDELEAYIGACEEILWSDRPEGQRVLAWLRGRGLSDEVLRVNRVGADPGPALPRAEGLPKGEQGATFPSLDSSGRPDFVQLRPLEPKGAKYRNPTEAFAPNPRMAVSAAPQLDGGQTVLVCEGFPDALTALTAGYRAVALLGTQTPNRAVADRLVAEFPTEHLVLVLDADESGQGAMETLADLLAEAGAGRRVWRVDVPEWVAEDPKQRDLNGWGAVADGGFGAQLGAAVTNASPAGWERAVMSSAADLLSGFLSRLDDRAGALAIPTGIDGLDRHLANGGWRPGLVLMAGLPGIGKSAFALHSGLTAAAAGHPVLLVMVEQSEDEFMGRLFCQELKRPLSAFWNRDPGFAAAAHEAASRLPLANLFVETDPFLEVDKLGTVGRVRHWTESLIEVTGRRPLVIVDYLQRMRPPEAERHNDERLRISSSGLGLRQLARDFDVPVLVVSSIGRGSYEGSPRLDWFKGSGDLEYDSDACIILKPDAGQLPDHLEPDRRVDVELHLVKNRYGPLTGEQPIGLFFDRRYGTFRPDPDRPGDLAGPGRFR